MHVAIVIAALLAAELIAGAVIVAVKRKPDPGGWLESVTGQRVLVHTVDDQTVEGSLFAVLADGILLKAPRLVDDQPIVIAGDLFIPRAKIALVQRPAGGDS